MRRRVALGIVLGMSVLLPALGRSQTQALPPAATHDCGIVKQGERLSHTFTIPNPSPATLQLELVALTQPGLMARFPPAIPPGKVGNVRLEWDTSRVRGSVVGEAVIRLGKADHPEVRFGLAAVVHRPIEFEPFAAVFLSAFQGESVQRSIHLVNHEARPLRVLGVEANSQRFTASVEPVVAGESYDLVVRSRSGAPLGRAEEAVHVLTDHPTLPRLTVRVYTLVKADVYLNPESVDFGDLALTDLVAASGFRNLLSQRFLLKTRAAEISITGVSSDLEMLDIRYDPPQGKGTVFQFEVGLNPVHARPGRIAGTIRIATNDPGFPVLSVPVHGEIR